MKRAARILAAAMAAFGLCALFAGGAGATLLLGISDESPNLFSNVYFKTLGAHTARYITPYDAAVRSPSGPDAWLAAAHAAGDQIVVAFNPGVGSRCPSAPCQLPSAAQYTAAFRAFHARYPYVRTFQPWNEVNSTTQPTWTKPQAVVTFYSIVKRYCQGCTVLGADIEDLVTPRQASYPVYIKALLKDFKKAHVAIPKLWGIHNYEDVNYFRSTNTKAMLGLLPGQIWLTETGGLAFFETSALKVLLPYSEARQNRATHWMMTLALKYPKRIARCYIYNFFNGGTAGPSNRFDSALLTSGGQPRLAWYALYYHYRGYFS